MEEIVGVAKLRIKIIKCSHEKYWYNNRVGEIFSVVDECVRDFYVKNQNGTSYGVLKIDAEVVSE